ncbi:hypothetical protein KW805_03865 [Candidatus Pacearchaeota archaeon]|nr:hypothetical protein [Candidatus Pacearchaeota archaeon]
MENEAKKMKMAIISGAHHALKYKKENWKASDEEIIQYISKDIKDILEKIDQEV